MSPTLALTPHSFAGAGDAWNAFVISAEIVASRRRTE